MVCHPILSVYKWALLDVDAPLAYFEQSLEATLGFIHRPTFEARLRSQIECETSDAQDSAWYALQNIVYAYGCRIVGGRDNSENAWRNAQTIAWQYFENAFAVHTELVYSQSTVSAVEALLAMVSLLRPKSKLERTLNT
jgi:hypothetical protein